MANIWPETAYLEYFDFVEYGGESVGMARIRTEGQRLVIALAYGKNKQEAFDRLKPIIDTMINDGCNLTLSEHEDEV